MKNKKWFFVLIGLMILTSLSIFGQTKKLRDIGRYKFLPIKAGTPAPEMMKVIAEKYADDIKRGFDLAGTPSLYAPFIDQIRQSAFTEKQLAVGGKMLWMIFRAQGQINVVYDLEWAGQAPLAVLSFSIQEGDKKYELIMPKACGNISLEKVESAGAAAPGEKQKPTAPGQPLQEKPEMLDEISKAKIFQEFGELINEVDQYCSFSVWEEEIPELRIVGAERESEKTLFSDADVIYLNKGNNGDVKPGQIFRVLEIRNELRGYGPMAFGKGRARVQFDNNGTPVAVVEHSCDAVRIGYYLVPFAERKGVTGKDLGYNVPPVEADGVKGSLVYVQNDLQQIARNHWALIDLGAEQGIQVGQQMILYRKTGKNLPVQILGNCIVIDVKSNSSTIKVLSCRDVIRKGDLVMERPSLNER